MNNKLTLSAGETREHRVDELILLAVVGVHVLPMHTGMPCVCSPTPPARIEHVPAGLL